jgi:hypothetical protein
VVAVEAGKTETTLVMHLPPEDDSGSGQPENAPESGCAASVQGHDTSGCRQAHLRLIDTLVFQQHVHHDLVHRCIARPMQVLIPCQERPHDLCRAGEKLTRHTNCSA